MRSVLYPAQNGVTRTAIDKQPAPRLAGAATDLAALELAIRQPAAAAGGWSDNTYAARICFYETPFIVTIRLQFSGDEVTFNSESNVGFGPTRQAELVGKAP